MRQWFISPTRILFRKLQPQYVDEDAIRKFWIDRGLKNRNQLTSILMLAHNRSIFNNLKKCEIRLKELHELMPHTDIVSVIGRFPFLLAFAYIKEPKTPTRHMSVEQRRDQLKRIFKMDDVDSMIARSPQILGRKPAQLEKQLQMFEKLWPTVNARRLARARPQLLSLRITTLTPKMAKLKELFPNFDIEQLIRRCPSLLSLDVEAVIRRNFEQLKQLIPNAERAIKLVPGILAFDVPTTIPLKFKQIQIGLGLSKEEALKFVERSPWIWVRKISSVVAKYQEFVEFFGPELAHRAIRYHPIMLQSSPPTVRARFKMLQQIAPDSCVQILSQFPQCVTCGSGVLLRLKYLDETGSKRSAITALKMTKAEFHTKFPDYNDWLTGEVGKLWETHANQLSKNKQIVRKLHGYATATAGVSIGTAFDITAADAVPRNFKTFLSRVIPSLNAPNLEFIANLIVFHTMQSEGETDIANEVGAKEQEAEICDTATTKRKRKTKAKTNTTTDNVGADVE